ncbi:MAG TPA: cation-transporting P-type ATPase [Casimicrobiaceae bacterium]|nr:cation-transporting P-type ATPase [Casimicrobiaceae bacterium]
MNIQRVAVADAIASVGGAPGGLSAAEAERRLREFGPNRVERRAAESPGLRFLKEFTHFFALILWLAAGLALLAEWSAPGQGMATIACAIVGVIVVSGLFSFWQEFRVERTLVALRRLLPQQVEALRGGAVVRMAAEELVPGDIVLLEQGNNVPADCRVIEAFGVLANNATVTGEALPQPRDAQPCEDEAPLHSTNVLLAGTSLVSGRAKAVVFATGMSTEFGRIAHLAQSGPEEASPLRRELARLSRVIAMLAILIGVAFFAVGQAIGVPFWQDFVFAIGIIVAMVPEGLLPTLTLALVLATQRMAKRNVLIRYLPAVETLGSTTVICTDKTGTLTQNRMRVKELFLGGTIDAHAALQAGSPAAERFRPLLEVALHCHDLREGEERGRPALLGDPMEIALLTTARQMPGPASASPRLHEIPFDAERMRLATVHEAPGGAMLYCKGASELVLKLCTRTLVDGSSVPLTEERRHQAREAENAMAEHGLRVIAFAYRPLGARWREEALERDLIFAGLAGLEDPPRPEVPDAVGKCREAGIRVIMVTGDHPRTAAAIAREVGLVRSERAVIVTGEELRRLSDTELRLALDAPEIVFARVGAEQKTRIVEALKAKGHVVAVTGDGVNDAPALKSAHIGIAMGMAGSDVAKESSDMVLLDDNFASIVSAVEEGRAVFENIRKFLTYILAHNVPELVPYLAFTLFPIPLALTPIQILSIDMGTDTLTALGLGVERPSPRVMQRPPRSRDERLFDGRLAARAYLFLGTIEAVVAMAAFFFVLHAAGWGYGQSLAPDSPIYLRATSACLVAIVVMQVVNVFLCRSASRSIVATGLCGNRWIAWGVVSEIALVALIVYTPLGNFIFGTAPISAETWLFLTPFAAALLLLEEARKWLVRKSSAGAPGTRRRPVARSADPSA